MTRRCLWAMVAIIAASCAVNCHGADLTVRDAKSSYVLRLGDGSFVVSVAADAAGAISKIDIQVVGGGPVPSPVVPVPVPIPPPPTPVPIPVPPPTPTPTPLVGVSLAVFNACPKEPALQSMRIAANFRAVATGIATGTYKTQEEVKDAIKKLNSGLTPGGTGWPEFGSWLGQIVAANDKSMAQLQAAFEAITAGLEARGKIQ